MEKSEPVELKHAHLICIIFCVHCTLHTDTHCTNDCFWAASTVFAIDDNHLPFAIIDANLFWCRQNGDTKDMSNQDFPFDTEVKETDLLFSVSFGLLLEHTKTRLESLLRYHLHTTVHIFTVCWWKRRFVYQIEKKRNIFRRTNKINTQKRISRVCALLWYRKIYLFIWEEFENSVCHSVCVWMLFLKDFFFLETFIPPSFRNVT